MKNLFRKYVKYHVVAEWHPKLFSNVLQNNKSPDGRKPEVLHSLGLVNHAFYWGVLNYVGSQCTLHCKLGLRIYTYNLNHGLGYLSTKQLKHYIFSFENTWNVIKNNLSSFFFFFFSSPSVDAFIMNNSQYFPQGWRMRITHWIVTAYISFL